MTEPAAPVMTSVSSGVLSVAFSTLFAAEAAIEMG
jgi:hypothetical protein